MDSSEALNKGSSHISLCNMLKTVRILRCCLWRNAAASFSSVVYMRAGCFTLDDLGLASSCAGDQRPRPHRVRKQVFQIAMMGE